jgi:hypothetical protein
MAKKIARKSGTREKLLNSQCAFDQRRACSIACHWYVAKTLRRFSGDVAGKCIIYEIKDIMEAISNRTR